MRIEALFSSDPPWNWIMPVNDWKVAKPLYLFCLGVFLINIPRLKLSKNIGGKNGSGWVKYEIRWRKG